MRKNLFSDCECGCRLTACDSCVLSRYRYRGDNASKLVASPLRVPTTRPTTQRSPRVRRATTARRHRRAPASTKVRRTTRLRWRSPLPGIPRLTAYARAPDDREYHRSNGSENADCAEKIGLPSCLPTSASRLAAPTVPDPLIHDCKAHCAGGNGLTRLSRP
jgi:hypothetical protein